MINAWGDQSKTSLNIYAQQLKNTLGIVMHVYVNVNGILLRQSQSVGCCESGNLYIVTSELIGRLLWIW